MRRALQCREGITAPAPRRGLTAGVLSRCSHGSGPEQVTLLTRAAAAAYGRGRMRASMSNSASEPLHSSIRCFQSESYVAGSIAVVRPEPVRRPRTRQLAAGQAPPARGDLRLSTARAAAAVAPSGGSHGSFRSPVRPGSGCTILY